jgi:hypothetical protein
LAAKNKISKKIQRKRRPKNIWNSVTKLGTFLKKAQIQSDIFMNTLYELRETLSFELRVEIVRALCNSVNGDILHALWEYNKRLDEGKFGNSIEENAIIHGMYDTLANILKIHPCRFPGERITINKDSAKDFIFEEYPEFLDDEMVERVSIEILRPGWKIDNKIVIKPIAFEVNSESDLLNTQSAYKQEGL